jgi:hypothetical protein
MLSEEQQDGHLLIYDLAPPQGRVQQIIHVNGVLSDVGKQLRDLETLTWLTVDQPMDIIGVHNSTHGIYTDCMESILGRAELFRTWAQNRPRDPGEDSRLNNYGRCVQQLVDLDLPHDCDILQAISTSSSRATTGVKQWAGGIAAQLGFDLSCVKTPLLQSMGNSELLAYLYGDYPAGAPRPTLRLAYEIIRAMRQGAQVYVVAHSQGTIIAALAFHLLERFFADYQKWTESLHFIGYGPAILLADLPLVIRDRTILIQARTDSVAESFSNWRQTAPWSNLQSQLKKLAENAEQLVQLVNADSHHSASHYLGLQGNPAGLQAAALLQQLLLQSWETPLIKPLCHTRIILENPQ